VRKYIKRRWREWTEELQMLIERWAGSDLRVPFAQMREELSSEARNNHGDRANEPSQCDINLTTSYLWAGRRSSLRNAPRATRMVVHGQFAAPAFQDQCSPCSEIHSDTHVIACSRLCCRS
jgi:hypothetical protein